MWYGKVPPCPFPFLEPGFVKRKRVNKLEPKAVLCIYIGSSPNRPRDSSAIIDSRHITWACIPSLPPVPDYPVGSMLGRGQGGSKPQSSDPRRWSLLEWSPTRAGRTKRTSGPRGATLTS